MTVDWEHLGPREKEVLGILRRHDGPAATREVLRMLRDAGADVAYTTVGTILERLTEKGVLERESEEYAGSTRYRYRFDPDRLAADFVEDVVSDVGAVLGEHGLARLEERAERARSRADEETGEA